MTLGLDHVRLSTGWGTLQRCTRPPTAASARTAPPRGGRFFNAGRHGAGARDLNASRGCTPPRAARALASHQHPNTKRFFTEPSRPERLGP